MVAALVALFAGEELPAGSLDGTTRQLALSMARLVDAGGPTAVNASRELRAVLELLAGRIDDDLAAFLRSVQTPGVRGDAGS